MEPVRNEKYAISTEAGKSLTVPYFARTTKTRVPHLRRSLIAPKVGIERSETALPIRKESHPLTNLTPKTPHPTTKRQRRGKTKSK
jgi:hypothetical protein